MKKFIVISLALAFSLNIYAQDNSAAQLTTEELVKVYDLSEKPGGFLFCGA